MAIVSTGSYLALMRKKVNRVKQRRRINNLTREQRRNNALEAAEKQRHIQKDLMAILALQKEKVNELAAKYGKTVGWMMRRLNHSTSYGGYKRAVSTYNAWIHCTSLTINDSKLDHSPG